MGDWNTLHFFDDKTFYGKVVPDLLAKGELLKKHFESKLGNSVLWVTITPMKELMRF